MNILRYYLMLLIGIFCIFVFIFLAGSIFVALLPVILPITIVLILIALFSGRRRAVIYTRTHSYEEEKTAPPASQDTIDITAVEVKDEK